MTDWLTTWNGRRRMSLVYRGINVVLCLMLLAFALR